jgi:hypothetical protein
MKEANLTRKVSVTIGDNEGASPLAGGANV